MATSPPLPTFALERRETVESELTRKLMDYLISARISPNEKLPSERQLSDALDVGRSALRSALKSLSLLGVIDQRPGSGTYLRDTTSDLLPRVIEWGLLLGENNLTEVIEAREQIEVLLAGLAAERRTEDDLMRLNALMAGMTDSDAVQDRSDYVEFDIQFHLAIAAASKNQVLAGVLRNLQSLLHAWASRVIEAAGETTSSLAVHVPILEAIRAGDAFAARESMQFHMTRASARLYGAIGGQFSHFH